MAAPILITGCAKSGTTLLFRMFNAFAGVRLLYGPKGEYEVPFGRLTAVADRNPGPVWVAKRKGWTIFSEALQQESLDEQAATMRASGLRIVNIVRDGRDVITSDRNYVPPARWTATMKQRDAYPDLITAEVRYERLVTEPDAVQEELAAALDLTSRVEFSTYPEFLPPAARRTPRGGSPKLYRLRPLDTASIGTRPRRGGGDVAFRYALRCAGYL